jgi:xanthine dehydrogenase accessory factor
MIVTRDLTLGTIGGGTLEFEVTSIAQTMLDRDARKGAWRRIVLGAGIGQCCGGVVELLLEPIVPDRAEWIASLSDMLRSGPCVMVRDVDAIEANPAERALVSETTLWGLLRGEPLRREEKDHARAILRNAHGDRVARKSVKTSVTKDVLMEVVRPYEARIMLFGAGHVGRALVHVLHHVPYDITWVDPRHDCFPAEVPANVTVLKTDDPEHAVAEAQPGTMFVVMTHSHALDLAICAGVLLRGDFRYLGLIGSRSKRRRFESRLRSLGLHDEALKRLACPIGSSAIQSKHPAFIAVSIAAEILAVATAAEFGSTVECIEMDGAHAVGSS